LSLLVNIWPVRKAHGSRWQISRERVDGSPLSKMSSLHEIVLFPAQDLVVHRGVAAAEALELVEEVEDDLRVGDLVGEDHAARAG
jgi:hypothetical protein